MLLVGMTATGLGGKRRVTRKQVTHPRRSNEVLRARCEAGSHKWEYLHRNIPFRPQAIGTSFFRGFARGHLGRRL